MKLLDINKFHTLTVDECIGIQNSLHDYIVEDSSFQLSEINTIAGVDIAYWSEGDIEKAVCCIVTLDIKQKDIIDIQYSSGEVKFPYIPGCFTFRELPLVIETTKQLKIKPDIYMFDGNGLLHPRNMGLATHASFYLGRPTIGVAKKKFNIPDTGYSEPGNNIGNFTNIVSQGKVIGRALRTKKDVKPVYISVGNYISLDDTTKLVLSLVGKDSHIPLPTRYADIETHKMRRELEYRSEKED